MNCCSVLEHGSMNESQYVEPAESGLRHDKDFGLE